MKFIHKPICSLLLCAALTAFPIIQAHGQDQQHVITMQDADIRSFIDDVAIVTGKTFLVDQRVNGNVTIASEQSLSKAEVFTIFKDVMRVHGYSVSRISTGDYRISPLQDSAATAPFVNNTGEAGTLATTIIRLQHVDAADAARLIKPVLHPQGVLSANPRGALLVITDFPENIKKAREIISALDVNNDVLLTVQLEHIRAIDAEDALNSLKGTQEQYKVVAVPNTNSVILEGYEAEISRLLPVLRKMDVPNSIARGAVAVVPLRFADGASVIEILTTLLPAYVKEGDVPPTVAYEPSSNTIIISASAETQEAMETVINRLDSRRPQVLIEAMVVEISDTVTQDLGVEFALGGVEGSGIPFFGTNFAQQPGNVLGLTGALVGEQAGLDTGAAQTAAVNALLGLEGAALGGGLRSGDGFFSVIANAIATDDNSNVLSTPFVTTLDNEPASFLVGQEIPIATGESLGQDNLNAFRTFERQEVGIKLNVLPQISEGDVIRLELKQEVSAVAGALSTLAQDFVTNTREIETTVLANDGEIIVLGGLLQDDEQIDFQKVPLLGDAPFIGNLFKSESKSRDRTNLMIFLRPTIIRNGDDAKPLTQSRLQYLREQDLRQSGRNHSKLDDLIDPFKNNRPSLIPNGSTLNGSTLSSSTLNGSTLDGSTLDGSSLGQINNPSPSILQPNDLSPAATDALQNGQISSNLIDKRTAISPSLQLNHETIEQSPLKALDNAVKKASDQETKPSTGPKPRKVKSKITTPKKTRRTVKAPVKRADNSPPPALRRAPSRQAASLKGAVITEYALNETADSDGAWDIDESLRGAINDYAVLD